MPSEFRSFPSLFFRLLGWPRRIGWLFSPSYRFFSSPSSSSSSSSQSPLLFAHVKVYSLNVVHDIKSIEPSSVRSVLSSFLRVLRYSFLLFFGLLAFSIEGFLLIAP
jgi:hypothetical protein